nr:dihydropteroate synthase [Nakamurella deserti]
MTAPGPLRLGTRTFAPTDLVVMAIVNRTPDSFYDQGATFAQDRAVEAAVTALDAGAAIVDIGGVKAGVGEFVSAAQEIDRVVPVVAEVRRLRPDAVISVDTWRAEVGRAVVAAGADLLNDAWEGHDPALAAVAGATGAGLVCMHAGHLPPRTDPHNPVYDDVVTDVVRTVDRLAAAALAAGVRPDGILVDPGHDFGKTTVQSLEVTRRLPELVATGRPVLVALSNKDFIGETLDLPTGDRLTGTMAAAAVSAWLGARVFRVHNVVPIRQVLDMVSAIRGDRPPAVARRGIYPEG